MIGLDNVQTMQAAAQAWTTIIGFVCVTFTICFSIYWWKN